MPVLARYLRKEHLVILMKRKKAFSRHIIFYYFCSSEGKHSIQYSIQYSVAHARILGLFNNSSYSIWIKPVGFR